MALFNINDTNGDSKLLSAIHELLLHKFSGRLMGAEFGVAYGGGIESICKTWKKRGTVYGFDTFTEHPKHLSDDPLSLEANCMDGWYNKYGKDKLSLSYIQDYLMDNGIYNFIFIKGEINERSLNFFRGKFHYVLLDFDLVKPMRLAYDLIKDKMVRGGYICVHDVVPEDHMPAIYNWWYGEVMPNNLYDEIMRGKHLGVYRVR